MWGGALRAQRPLPTGIVRRQFPSLRGTTWRNNGRRTRKVSRFKWSPYSYLKWRILIFTRRNWKCHVIIVIKTDLSGSVVTMHSGLCEQYAKSLGQRPRDLPSCFARTLVHCDKKTIIGSDNGLSPGRRQVIIWTNAGIMLIGPSANFSEILIEIYTIHFHSRKCIWKYHLENGGHLVSASMR